MNAYRSLIVLLSFFIFLPVYALADWEPRSSLSYVYLTWEKSDTSTHMTVNYHSSMDYEVPQVFYSETSAFGDISKYENRSYGKTLTLPGIKRAFHRVTLENLKPGTTYYFAVGDKNVGFSQEFNFKTIPNDGTPITFITGGDMGTSSSVGRLLELSARTNPDFVAIGGDIAYANGKLRSFDKWDRWLKLWTENMTSADGRIIPVSAAIGNHEVGSGINNLDRAPFFFALFEQGGLEKPYFHRYFGENTIMYYLDTGHVTSHAGEQNTWLETTMESNKKLEHQLAIYHIPLYPSHRRYNGSGSKKGRRSWLGTFDNYKLDLAFENHDHTVKVTHPLKGGEIVASGEGTIYLGDGCFGRSPRSAKSDRWYLETAESERHFWHVTIDGSKTSYKAIGENNNTLYKSN